MREERQGNRMKITIAYATKTGTTAKAAAALAQALEARGFETKAFDLATQKPDMHADAFVLGGSIRIGQWRKAARAFARANETALLAKPLALFVCRCGQEALPTLLAAQIGQPLVAHAAWTGCLGGEMDLAQQKGFDRWIVRMIQKSEAGNTMATPGIVDENVAACADALAAALNG